jgi:hypothetical protein
MRHRGAGGSAEYAMHDVYFEREKGVVGYTREARSPRLPSAAKLKAWIEEQLGSGRDTVVCGDLGCEYAREDLELWLRHAEDPPLEYDDDSSAEGASQPGL